MRKLSAAKIAEAEAQAVFRPLTLAQGCPTRLSSRQTVSAQARLGFASRFGGAVRIVSC